MRLRPAYSALILAALTLTGCDAPKPRGEAAKAQAAGGPKAPYDAAPVPAPPAWAQGLVGKTLSEAFAGSAKCMGNTDVVMKVYGGSPGGVQIHGWGWDPERKVGVARVLLVNKDFRIVGAGQGGVPRPDVQAAGAGVTIPDAGWNADAPVAAGPLDAYGVLDEKTTCRLGHIEF
ncbi:MAG: hypothetical protein DI570_06750 [Phenylobacterium zucineum]|nr:MAG: hypothetical protein DI570_06750 [Phenylobacterium zucineum]